MEAFNDGGYLVASYVSDDSGKGIKCTLLSEEGETKSESYANTPTSGYQAAPAAAVFADDRFFVAWATGGSGDGVDIRGQLFDSDGTKLGENMTLNILTDEEQEFPQVAPAGEDAFVVTWMSEKKSSWQTSTDLRFRLFDLDGSAQDQESVVLSQSGGAVPRYDLAGLVDGSFAVVWNETDAVHATLFLADGVEALSPIAVSGSSPPAAYSWPSVAPLSNGGLVVVWQSELQDGDDDGVFAQRLDAFGAKQGGQFQVNDLWIGEQSGPSVSPTSSGGFAVVFRHKNSPYATSGCGVIVQLFDSEGVADGNPIMANECTTSYTCSGKLAVAGLAGDKFVTAWLSDSTVYARRYGLEGTEVYH